MRQSKRPVLIMLLAILYFIAGVACIAFLLFYAVNPEAFQLLAQKNNLSQIQVLVAFVILIPVGIGTGIGFWRGRKWGWYLGTSLYFIEILTVLLGLTGIGMFFAADEAAARAASPEVYAGKLLGLVVPALLLVYLFSDGVKQFFRLPEVTSRKSFWIHFVLCLAFSFILIIVVGAPVNVEL